VAEGIQHRQAAQFAGLPAACPCSDQPDTAGLGTGGGYAVKCANELGTKKSQANVEGFPIEDEWYLYYPQGKKPSVLAKVFADYMLSEGG